LKDYQNAKRKFAALELPTAANEAIKQLETLIKSENERKEAFQVEREAMFAAWEEKAAEWQQQIRKHLKAVRANGDDIVDCDHRIEELASAVRKIEIEGLEGVAELEQAIVQMGKLNVNLDSAMTMADLRADEN
jgi:chromosome segregation ATPase